MKALVPIVRRAMIMANGSEEIELTTIANILVRGGIEVELTSVHTSKEITGSRGIHIVANSTIDEIQHQSFDLIVLPGGMPGAEHLRDCNQLIQMLKKQKTEGKYFAAICASPSVVFDHHKLLEGHKACGYPCFKLPTEIAAEKNPRVVVSGNCITSVGPSSAIQFALKLVELLKGKDVAFQVSEGLLVV